ncbi:SsgA family sporulation/cell division regulator [Streptomyces sp. QTS137]
MNVVEQYARAQIVTDTDAPQSAGRTVPIRLGYDPGRDPRTVRVSLSGPAGREWSLRRELLEQGLRAPAGSGDVQVWPCGRVQVVVEFHSARGVSMVQFETKALTRFLHRVHVAAATAEPVPH